MEECTLKIMEITTDIFNKKYSELNPKLQDVLVSQWYMSRIFAIGSKNKLTKKQTAEMSDEATLIIMGFVQQSELKVHLAQRLGVPENLAEQLKNDIESIILSKTDEAAGANDSDPYIQEYLSGAYEIDATELSLVDSKLGQSAPQTNIEQSVPIQPSLQTEIQKNYIGTKDPYREAI